MHRLGWFLQYLLAFVTFRPCYGLVEYTEKKEKDLRDRKDRDEVRAYLDKISTDPIPEDEFDPSLDLDLPMMMRMNEEEKFTYSQIISRRRRLAHESDFV